MIGWLVAICAFTAAAYWLWRWAASLRCRAPMLVVFATQALGGLILLSTMGLVGDGNSYQAAAVEIANSLQEGDGVPEIELALGKQSVSWLLGFTYWLTTPSAYVGVIVLALCAAIVPLLVGYAMVNFDYPQQAPVAAWLIALCPPIIFWEGGLRRESIAFVGLGMALVAMSFLFARHYRYAGIWSAISALVLGMTRPALIVVLAFGLLAAVLLSPSIRGMTRRRRAALRTVVTATATLAIYCALQFTYVAGQIGTGSRDEIIASNSAPSYGLAVGTVGHFPPWTGSWLWRVTVTIVDTLFGPMPWEWRSIPYVVAGLDGLFMLLVVAAWVFTLIKVEASRPILLVISFAAIPLVAAESLTHANYGITMRVRAHILLVLIPGMALFAAWVAERARERVGGGGRP